MDSLQSQRQLSSSPFQLSKSSAQSRMAQSNPQPMQRSQEQSPTPQQPLADKMNHLTHPSHPQHPPNPRAGQSSSDQRTQLLLHPQLSPMELLLRNQSKQTRPPPSTEPSLTASPMSFTSTKRPIRLSLFNPEDLSTMATCAS